MMHKSCITHTESNVHDHSTDGWKQNASWKELERELKHGKKPFAWILTNRKTQPIALHIND